MDPAGEVTTSRILPACVDADNDPSPYADTSGRTSVSPPALEQWDVRQTGNRMS